MALQAYQEPSPLAYERSSNVQRYGILDPELVDLPFEKNDTYFAQTSRIVRRGVSGRVLKNPRTEITPGARPGSIAWVDWHPMGNGWLYIDFMKVRQDARGGRYGSQLIDGFYHDIVLGQGYQGVHWGRVLHPHAWSLKKRMKQTYAHVADAGYPDF